MSPVSSQDRRLHAAMAGRGNPYAVLTPERLPLLRALHAELDIASVAALLGSTPELLERALTALVAAGLVAPGTSESEFVPRFVIVDAAEVRRVDRHARDSGHALAERLLERWPRIERVLADLALPATQNMAALGFLLVGDRILDVGLLDVLAADGRLMPAAPPRPTPDDPQARYYLWMIEGERTDLGQYGQQATSLRWPGWEMLTFGRYAEPGTGSGGPAREQLEAALVACAAREHAAGPAALAAAFALPCFDQLATAAWDTFAAQIATDLLEVYLVEEPALRELWFSLRASRVRHDAFGEFFCWYDHLAYAHAIDACAAAGLFQIPPAGYSVAIWHAGDERGPF
jgi:hypothetical protein